MKEWYVLFTGYENTLVTMKRMVKDCLPRGCGVYAPSTIKANRERPTRLYNQSVFPFYIFVCCTEISQLAVIEERLKQLRIDGYFLRDSSGKLGKLTSNEVREIEMHNSNNKQVLLTEKDGFSSGSRVRVVEGPMKGLEGSIAFLTEDFAFLSVTTSKKKLTIEVPMLYTDLELL